ncbi:cancer-associated gene 1 protein isoform X5 [Callithrix jacchus]
MREGFYYSTVTNKDYQKFGASPSDPVHFEVDTSHEKLESMSKSDTVNVSNLCQGLTLSDSPICMETTSTTCDLPQTSVPSKEIQNYGEIPEMSVSHQKEVTAEGMERPEIVSTWSLANIFWRSKTSQENCKMPDMEQSTDSLQPLEEDMALNEVLQKLKHTNRKQEVRIQELQYSNVYLEKRVKELQMKITKQQVFVDVINKLKENVEELIEDKYKIMLEKNYMKKTLQNLQEILANTQKRLQESRNEKEMLQLQFKKIKANYMHLQERYMAEMQQKNESSSQYLEMDKALSKKEEEVERLQQLKEEIEKATVSALNLLKQEKETQEQEFLSLQVEFQNREKENLEEKQKLKFRLEKLLAQVKNLQFMSENERAKNIKFQQQIIEVKSENAKLKQQVGRSEEQNCVPKYETARLKEQLEEVMKSDITKDTKMTQSNLLPDCLPCEEKSLNPDDSKRSSQLDSEVHRLLALMVRRLTCQDVTNSDAEHFEESEKVSDIMLRKLKSLHLKKKTLDKELLKHKDRITTFRELIANEKSFQDHTTEVTDCDSDEAKSVRYVTTLLGAKLDKYHSLNEELDFLSSFQDYSAYQKDSYHKDKNTLGFINLGTSENKLCIDLTTERLQESDMNCIEDALLQYPDWRGQPFLREDVAQFLTCYCKAPG